MSIQKIAQNTFKIITVSFSVIIFSSLFAATPNPGHPWREVGDGWWAATGTTAFRTFTFPDATSTVLTTNDLVTIAQGGTGQNSTSSALNSLTGLTTKGDIFASNGSIGSRFVVGGNNQVLVADAVESLGIKWATLMASPSGSDTHVQFNDGGVGGGVNTLTFNKVNKTFGVNGKLDLVAQTDPTATTSNTLSVYSKNISSRTMLKALAPSGVNYAFQPSFFQNSIFILSTGAGTAYTVVGNIASSTGTVSHVVSEPVGYMANQVTAASATGVAGTFSSTTQFYRGSQDGSNGFFFQARMHFPTATSTTYRVFVGLTSGGGAASVSADNPVGDHAAFQYSTGRADTGWKFMTKDGTTQNVSATLIPFSITGVFDFFIYCPPYPNNGTIYYRIDNITTGQTVEGSTSTNLPTGNVLMRAGFFLGNITGTSLRNIRVSRLYVETDR